MKKQVLFYVDINPLRLCDVQNITVRSTELLLTLVKIFQYNETNVLHFLFSSLRIKGLYMFQASPVPLQPWCGQPTYHARNIPSAACVVPPEDEQVSPTPTLVQSTDITRFSRYILSNTTRRTLTRTHYIGDMFRLTL
jgi:hypothetical protein